MDLKQHIRGVPDFPIPGILFYDISTILNDPKVLDYTLSELQEKLQYLRPDIIAGIESRGFLFATPLANRMNLPMMMIRKQGKLPGEVISHEYALEYGTDIIEIHSDALKLGQRVVILDDLLATGGTLSAAVKLCQQAGAEVVGCAVVIELDFLNGRELIDVNLESLVHYQ
tara:strand:- start:176 stop:688 length:513 start_codon:yes stop_codon:yes gene_type:complete